MPEYQDVIGKFLSMLSEWGVDQEDGPGQFEAHFQPKKSSEELAADVAKFKEGAESVANELSLRLSFEPKPLDDQPGNAFHVHYSHDLFDPYGLEANGGVMLPKNDPNNKYVLWAMGGMLEKLPAYIDAFLPTEAAKKRIVPYMNAPTKICWGNNNRSVAMRVPDGKPKRIEHRVAGADVDYKLVIDKVIEAAEFGIENEIAPGEPIFGNAWDKQYERPGII